MTAQKSFSWNNVSVKLPKKGKQTSTSTTILDNLSGCLESTEANPGCLMALMGPSGSGKTTLLNVLAQRNQSNLSGSITGEINYNGESVTKQQMTNISSYVEQEDSLIGALTVKETIDYSAQLTGIPSQYRRELVEETISLLGLQSCQDVKVGNALQKGISGGQKRRTSIASQIITKPSVLFLDEPTSGLDSVAAREVIQMIKKVAQSEKMIVICSIHQPSSFTFELFDQVLFLCKGEQVYQGRVDNVTPYFLNTKWPIPLYCNPAEFILDLTNTDFSESGNDDNQLQVVNQLVAYNKAQQIATTNNESLDSSEKVETNMELMNDNTKPIKKKFITNFKDTFILSKRTLTKSNRDVLAYHVRVVMYLGLAILMGTVWLRLSTHQENIQTFINAIFFSGAFMSFMSVAYIPSYIEDVLSYRKEYSNGLYGPLAFTMSNFLIGLPFLFGISLMFSIITYFMVHFHQLFTGFAYYTLWLFLDLVAAESMTVCISTIIPNFVISLALTAFANGLWMSVGGFLVSSLVLNKFWYYTFYWIDYQRYVFQGMMFNEFTNRNFECDSSCHCMYDSDLALQCKIKGDAVLTNMGYSKYDKGLWIGILIVLIFVYRFVTYLALKYLRK